ncbi:hypothetical protein P872_15295 [Rhodonellum psychrophilum GCM71 = DSM 17998]|uniref:Rhodanese domain-containing protein n=2 Tax=Rhodonellum TaxID=336827 RepID=U5C7F3_9BACT|nr:hypothetical protein P872_15295 [Rhodonellum psychrophilum GCM71 = DSM 17998]SDZ20180.1 Glyoxylase, beta-lactamase superfamily II [Rhodonellum ikkaensis]
MKKIPIYLLLFLVFFSNADAFQFEQLIKAKSLENVEIKQFEDDGLAHFSYAVGVDGGIVLVDPGRDPQPYYDYAASKNAKIIGVIETHPHADFVSSHLEIYQTTGATIYVSKLVGANYPHQAFDEGDEIVLSPNVKLRAVFTPGHSPDGISIVVEENGEDVAVFTGDTLFIGDVGRPDLRESAGSIMAKREELAKMMYKSTREKLMTLDDEVAVFPAHGAGSLCGKSMSQEKSSTIGAEKATNYALQEMTEAEFVSLLLEDQPFIPKYFPFNVDVNKIGAEPFVASVEKVTILERNYQPGPGSIIIDGRHEAEYKASHLEDAVNIMDGAKFETWLGSIVAPGDSFYLIGKDEVHLQALISKTAKIGYETFIQGAFVFDAKDGMQSDTFDQDLFDQNKDAFTIIDIRNAGEVAEGKVFENAINIPLPELMERAGEIPTGKPVVIHCGTGYRSAAGSSIVKNALKTTKVLDMSGAILEYKK